MTKFLKDKKNLVIILLSTLFILKIPQEEYRFIFWVLGGVSFCSILDFAINSVYLKNKIFPNSAIISGFIISGILDYQQPWFVLIIFSCIGILSKHIFKFNKKHIFNPANFALFTATLFKFPLTWNIESNKILIIILGLYLAYSYKKLTHILGFLVFFVGLFGLLKINAFAIISWFFLFIMLIEPKTSGYGALRGFLFGSIAGIASFLSFKFLPVYDFFVSSLFVANLYRVILEKVIK